jgi:hypothetical protein
MTMIDNAPNGSSRAGSSYFLLIFTSEQKCVLWRSPFSLVWVWIEQENVVENSRALRSCSKPVCTQDGAWYNCFHTWDSLGCSPTMRCVLQILPTL